MKTYLLLILFTALVACEKEPGLPARGDWSGSNPNYDIQMSLAQFDILVKGSGTLTKKFATTHTYKVQIIGECSYPYINLQFYQGGYKWDFRGVFLDQSTIQGKLDNDLSITFIK